jgi:hypothetical protein
MSDPITKHPPETRVIPFDQLKQMATALGKNKLFGKTAEELLPLMLIAEAEGKHPAIAAQEYDIIMGKPAINSRAALSRFQLSGGRIGWKERTDAIATAVFVHPSCIGEVEITWTIERAAKAGLTGKDNWRKIPAQMLSARVVAEGVRACFPACLSGMYTSEEVQDFVREPRDVTPDAPIIPVENSEVQPEHPTEEKAPAVSIEFMRERVDKYVTRAELAHYISPAMAVLYRKDKEEHKNDIEVLTVICSRIEAQVAEVKAKMKAPKQAQPAEDIF